MLCKCVADWRGRTKGGDSGERVTGPAMWNVGNLEVV
jgi:hypothetical protein